MKENNNAKTVVDAIINQASEENNKVSIRSWSSITNLLATGIIEELGNKPYQSNNRQTLIAITTWLYNSQLDRCRPLGHSHDQRQEVYGKLSC